MGKEELKKGPWTREEDQKLLAYIEEHGHGRWRSLPAKAGLQRCGKSCRLRWKNYLRPDIKRGKFSFQEENTIIQLHALLGNRWSAIATHLPKRTDNEVKNYWNTRLKKRLTRMGIDPVTHKPKNFSSNQSKDAANLSHMTQWESARLEAEARLVRQSNLHLRATINIPPPLSSLPPPPPLFPCLDVLKVWEWLRNTTNDPTTISEWLCNTTNYPTTINSYSITNYPTRINSYSITNYPTRINPYSIITSPTSTLNFSRNFMDGNCSSVTNMIPPNNYLDDHQVKDTMKINPMQIHEGSFALYDPMDSFGVGRCMDDSILPISQDGYNNIVSSSGDFGEIKDCWNDVLNLVNSSTGYIDK